MMKIVLENGVAKIFSPYNKDFVSKIKMIGGSKWDYGEYCWKVPENSVDTVREFMMEVYGYSDISENETISVKVTFLQYTCEECSSIAVFGKTIAYASGRDSGAKPGIDVAVLHGEIESGGSRRYWKSIVNKGSSFMLRNVNKKVFERGHNTPYNISVEIVDDTIDKQNLIEEKERLLKRIEEIDKMLEEEN